ncbi:MAG TPA: AMP-binding protein, partial [Planctomycetaceae bacterium]|nr:AMP-binding protein [Planctomycetaceae bacterium]
MNAPPLPAPGSCPERLDRAALQARQWEKLSLLLNHVVPENPFWSARFAAAGLCPTEIRSLDDFRRLPCVTKADLAADQLAHPPYGSVLTYNRGEYVRLHQTSGTTGRPLRWLDTRASWDWILECWAQIFRLIGLESYDRLCFPFSFGPFLGFWAAFEGANRLGNLCLAAGGMSTQARLNLIAENEATFVCCTPTYALRLAEEAEATGFDLAGSSVRGLLVAGEPGGNLPATRQRLEQAWGARVFDHWGMTELGPMAVEVAEDPGNLCVLESECLAEIVDPATCEPVPAGTPGELVLTNLGRWGSPLLRYRTGDLVVADPHPGHSCSLLRLRGGILSRTDDMLTIRGNNIYPTVLEDLIRQFTEIAEYRITVVSRKAMQHVQIEFESLESSGAGDLTSRLERTIKDRLNFQAEIIAVSTGSLPRFEMKGRRFVR